MNNLPKISIVIPVYNKAKYIGQTLQSIIDQKYHNLELIIQDGGSTDGSVEIIKDFAKKNPKVITWVSKKDDGQLAAINIGLKKTSGDILAYINADDIYKKGILDEVGIYFKNNPQTLWLTGGGDIIDNSGKISFSLVTAYKNLLLKLNKFSFLLMVNYLTQPSTFLSREAYLKYGPFNGTKKYIMEYEMWLKLGKVKMPALLNKTLSSFRLTSDNISSTSYNELLKNDYDIAKKYSRNPIILGIHYLHNFIRITLIQL